MLSKYTSKRKPRGRSSERTVARGFVVLSKRADTNLGPKNKGYETLDQIQMKGPDIPDQTTPLSGGCAHSHRIVALPWGGILKIVRYARPFFPSNGRSETKNVSR